MGFIECSGFVRIYVKLHETPDLLARKRAALKRPPFRPESDDLTDRLSSRSVSSDTQPSIGYLQGKCTRYLDEIQWRSVGHDCSTSYLRAFY